MNYLTPAEQIQKLEVQISQYKDLVEKQYVERDNLQVQRDFCHSVACNLNQANKELSTKVEALKHSVICLLIVAAGLIICSAIILKGGI